MPTVVTLEAWPIQKYDVVVPQLSSNAYVCKVVY